jgi:hypothetical protein
MKNEDYYKRGLKKSELEHGSYYKGECRNATIARWNSEKQMFYHWRTKFNYTFIETIKHYEDEEHYDVFIALEKIENYSDKEINF